MRLPYSYRSLEEEVVPSIEPSTGAAEVNDESRVHNPVATDGIARHPSFGTVWQRWEPYLHPNSPIATDCSVKRLHDVVSTFRGNGGEPANGCGVGRRPIAHEDLSSDKRPYRVPSIAF